ncbi:DUF2837 family protein [Paenibacillus polygoni]|uniref:DUF2837 family protein n=1 Tax=Paenibacillus polygoni TaxID=3050112 RepID=A0ABY8WY65_9BACL|nr:DUF2837 family protein [Paenibacillus polygoni]WIV18096.1 DUF2837 family protein [Paenibacillus polygoni]
MRCTCYSVRCIYESSTSGNASQSTGLINGIATILLAMLIDPKLALLSDRTLRGEIPVARMNNLWVYAGISACWNCGSSVSSYSFCPMDQLDCRFSIKTKSAHSIIDECALLLDRHIIFRTEKDIRHTLLFPYPLSVQNEVRQS